MQTFDYLQHLATAPSLIDLGQRLIPFFFLALCRIVPFVHLTPYLGSKTLPAPVKVSISIGLFLFLAPTIATSAQGMELSIYFFGYVLKEFLLGYMIGTLTALPSYALMMAGTLIDHQRGASSLMITDPVLQIQDSLTGILFVFLLVNISWFANLPFIYIEAVAKSFDVIPLNGFLPHALLEGSNSAVALVRFKEILGQIFLVGIQLAAPSLIILLMTDMFLGIVNRLAPQVQISFLAQGLKALLALVILFMGWRFILQKMAQEGVSWAQLVQDFVARFNY